MKDHRAWYKVITRVTILTTIYSPLNILITIHTTSQDSPSIGFRLYQESGLKVSDLKSGASDLRLSVKDSRVFLHSG